MLLRCGQTVHTAAAVRQLFPLCLGSHVQPNRPVSETRNPRAEPTTSIGIFLQSTALNGSNLRYFIWQCSVTFIWLKQNREVGLCDWNIIVCDTTYPRFLNKSMTKYYFPHTAVQAWVLKYWYRLASKFLYRWLERSMDFTVSCQL